MPATTNRVPDVGPTLPETTGPAGQGAHGEGGNTGTKDQAPKALMYVPLVLVNSAAVYGQVAYAYEKIAPEVWNTASKVALALMFAAAIESVAVYVGWHAHDALLQKATATAARLRRASYLLAGIVGAINYAHFAGNKLTPTAAAVAFGLLSLLSPWLWGLHTRRVQHVRLTREGAVDVTGATFSGERIRAFPIRAYLARRWSIDHYVTDPRKAWEGYNASVAARRANRQDSKIRAVWLVLAGRAVVHPGVAPTRSPSSSAFAPGEPQPSQPCSHLPTQVGAQFLRKSINRKPVRGSQGRSHTAKAEARTGVRNLRARAGATENPGEYAPAKVAESAPAKVAEYPAESAPANPTAKVEKPARKPSPVPTDDGPESVRKLAAAFARKPTGTNAELAKLAKVSIGSANRHLPKIRAAKTASENADDSQERPQAAAFVTPIPAPRPAVTTPANGALYPTRETS